MLSLLKIRNIALIDELHVEFKPGLNLLTGETGSGKSIVVDSLGALTGTRVSSDLIKDGESKARIEGLFNLEPTDELCGQLEASGIDFERSPDLELIVRRELSASGRNRVFINNQMVTQGFLKEIGHHLANIHGQGEQSVLMDSAFHLSILDRFAETESELKKTRILYSDLRYLKKELSRLREDDAQKLQLLDILSFQTDEISSAKIEEGEDDSLEAERKKLLSVEKLSQLSGEAYGLLYEDDDAASAKLEKVSRLINDLGEYDPGVGEYAEEFDSARAVLDDLAIYLRDFRNSIKHSPSRLEEIEGRLAELAGLKRKYGGTLDAVLQHFEDAAKRLENIRTAEEREKELQGELREKAKDFLEAAKYLQKKREGAARKFEAAVGKHCASVALEKAKFEVRFNELGEDQYTEEGIDDVEFYFSANPGESTRPLAKVASGGEASRLMLILKTVAGGNSDRKAVVFDEIDSGIGGRVAEAVGMKLKSLAQAQQVLCVTHQPQIASLADSHYIVEKSDDGKRTTVAVREIKGQERLEEIARMLAGEDITDAARENARSMLSAKA